MIRHTLPLLWLSLFSTSCAEQGIEDTGLADDSSYHDPHDRNCGVEGIESLERAPPRSPADPQATVTGLVDDFQAVTPRETFYLRGTPSGSQISPVVFGEVSGTGFGPTGAQDIKTCRQCKDAAMSTDVEVWHEFCRALSDKAARARCWEKAHESKPKRSNWCQDEFCN